MEYGEFDNICKATKRNITIRDIFNMLKMQPMSNKELIKELHIKYMVLAKFMKTIPPQMLCTKRQGKEIYIGLSSDYRNLSIGSLMSEYDKNKINTKSNTIKEEIFENELKEIYEP